MGWTTMSEAVRMAAADPRVAAVLAKSDGVCAAIVARDIAGFRAGHWDDFIVNSPANRVLTSSQAEQGFAAGLIDYHSLDRKIDHVEIMPEGLIVVMGEEIATPRGRAQHAGRTIRRRFTDVWRLVDDDWRVAVRQATITAVD